MAKAKSILVVLVAAIVQLTVLMVSCNAKIYSIPEGWSVRNNDTLPEFQGNGRSGSYRLVSAFPSSSSKRQESVLSDNGTFGLAFLNFNGTNKYYLSVMMGTRNASTAAPVWSTNRSMPVGRDAILTRSLGRLRLLDSSMLAWSPSEQSIAYISLEESGNFQLLNESRVVVWQSFDHPTNALLPNQRLVSGQRLISNANDSSMAEGIFTVTMEPSGVVLYLSIPSKQQQPYFLWGAFGSSLSSARQVCNGYRTVLTYSAAGQVNIVYESNPTATSSPGGQPCGSPLSISLLTEYSMSRYLQLEPDGNIHVYKLEAGSWELEFEFGQYLQNNFPLACGSYGIHDSGGQCKCLDHGANNYTTSTSGKCSKPTWSSLANCSTRYETEFVTISGGSYFANSYNSPDRTSASLVDCLETCRSNCSCSALFYDQTPRNCYFLQDVLGSLTVDQSKSQQLSAFLKFQNQSKLVPLEAPSSRGNKKFIVRISSGLGTASFVTMVCFLLLLWLVCRKQSLDDLEINRLLSRLQGAPTRFSYRSLQLATKGFSKHLGTGGFGSVYEGNLPDGQKLAVKRLNSADQGQKQFIAEVASLGTISHINIVRLCGFCADPSHRLLVYEFMPNGSLDKWIFSSKSSDSAFEWSLRVNIALGTARGLAYLHEESREPIIHLDIKPQNILLDENFVAKVGDFGMAKLLVNRDISQVVTGVRGTPGYLAPEWLLHSIATKKCDVYSYGMVLLELIGGRKNLDTTKLDSNLSWYFPAWAIDEMRQGNMMNVVDPRIRDEANALEAKRLIHVAFWCIQENPAARPTMDAVVQMLEGQQEVPDPPLTFYFAVQASGILSITASSDCTAFAYSESPIEPSTAGTQETFFQKR